MDLLLNTLNQTTVQLRRVTCHSCAAVYAMAEEWLARRQQDGQGWACPYCKTNTVYSEPENKKLKEQLESMRKNRDWYLSNASAERAAREKTERRLIAQRRETKKLRVRVKHGVCPCCTRTFSNLAAHMETKHPEFKP